MAWLVRISISDPDLEGEREMTQCLLRLHDRRPDWIKGMQELSRVETRQHLRQRGLSLETFAGLDIGVVTLPPDLITVPERYGVKLGKALYYLHAGRVLPKEGTVRVAVFPNTDFMAAQFPLDRFVVLTARPIIARSGKSLHSQFSYRFATSAEDVGAAFLVQFGESTAMVLLAVEDAAAYAERSAMRLSTCKGGSGVIAGA